MLVCVAFAGAPPATAQSPRCLANGDIATLDGIASLAARDTRVQEWDLHLDHPVCIARLSNQARDEELRIIRIIGMPPPLGIPLQLTGKVLLAKTAPSMFAALVVISGRRARAVAEPLLPSRPLPAPQALPLASPAQKAAARCEAPPYGGTLTDYKTFVERFGAIIKPQKILAGICNAKFGSASREGLHKLGFSDAKIQSENTEQLAVETIVALKTLVKTIE